MNNDQFDRASQRIMDLFSETIARAIADIHEGVGSLKDKVEADIAAGDASGEETQWPKNYEKCVAEMSAFLESQPTKMAAEVQRLQSFATAALRPMES